MRKSLLTFLFTAFWLTGLSKSDSVCVSSIEIQGNHKTKAFIILRELSFDTTTQLSEVDLESYHIPRSTANLKNLNLFNTIDITHELRDDCLAIRISVTEKWYLWPIPFIEFADRNFNQWQQFDFNASRTNFGLYLFKYNQFGRNHTVKLTLGSGYTRAFGLEYRAPYINDKKTIGFDVDTRWVRNREIQYDLVENREQFHRNDKSDQIEQYRFNVGVNYRPKLYGRHRISAGIHNIVVSDYAVDSLNYDYLFNGTGYQGVRLGYQYQYDKRNNRLFPLRGTYGEIGAEWHGVRDNSYLTLSGNFTRFGVLLPQLDRLKTAFQVVGEYRTAENLPYFFDRILGYKYAVRGYELYAFNGRGFVMIKPELRWMLLKERMFNWKWPVLGNYQKMAAESYFSAFMDIGVIAGSDENQLLGYGFGINTLLYLDKVFRFEYSWNHWGEAGLKIHFKQAF